MAQKLFEDKITTLQESGGNITLPAGARLTIGGQQYTTTSALIVAADLSTANTRYQIYAVLNSGVVELVVSSNENSIGPAGYSAWKLVGSYYTNGLSTVGFGSFMNINESPKTDEILFDMTIDGSTAAPTKGGGSLLDRATWSRHGSHVLITYNYAHTVAGAAGSGTYLFLIPFTANTAVLPNTGDITLSNKGSASAYIGGSIEAGFVKLHNINALAMEVPPSPTSGITHVASTNYALSNAICRYSFSTDAIPIQGWTNTPIEDL